jgi:hypothetical protein
MQYLDDAQCVRACFPDELTVLNLPVGRKRGGGGSEGFGDPHLRDFI